MNVCSVLTQFFLTYVCAHAYSLADIICIFFPSPRPFRSWFWAGGTCRIKVLPFGEYNLVKACKCSDDNRTYVALMMCIVILVSGHFLGRILCLAAPRNNWTRHLNFSDEINGVYLSVFWKYKMECKHPLNIPFSLTDLVTDFWCHTFSLLSYNAVVCLHWSADWFSWFVFLCPPFSLNFHATIDLTIHRPD